jgi:hypothetical protein
MDTAAAAAAEEAHLTGLDALERQGIELLDEGANPAKMAGALLAVVCRLQLEGRFASVDFSALENAVEQVVAAQEDER